MGGHTIILLLFHSIERRIFNSTPTIHSTMSTEAEPATTDSSNHQPGPHLQEGIKEKLHKDVSLKRTPTPSETDRNLVSMSTVTLENSEIWMMESQLTADVPTLTLRTPAATPDKQADSVQVRGILGQWRCFRLRWLTAYRILTSIVISINVAIQIYQLATASSAESRLTATAANIMVAVLMRQEELINIGFRLASELPSTLPLAVRKTIGDLHHFGGVHVGCALSALLWYVTFVVLNTVRIIHLLSNGSVATSLYIDVITAYTTLLVILAVCITATPRFRVRFHNTFEATHRFGGWAALTVLWIHTGIASLAPDSSTSLHTRPALWMLALTTLLILQPWLRIRRVPITVHPISPREIQLSFPYAHMPFTSTMHTSTAPLTEWHAFATIPTSSSSAKIIISKAGDWTSAILAAPPQRLWIRRPPTLNFLSLAPLFNSLLLVATGAGIGPMLSLLASPAVQHMRRQNRVVKVLWCVANPGAQHWGFVVDAIRDVDASPAIFDSRVGRPDLLFEARWVAEREGVEAVMVVSNPRVTRVVVDGCKMAGFAAYGAVFDS